MQLQVKWINLGSLVKKEEEEEEAEEEEEKGQISKSKVTES